MPYTPQSIPVLPFSSTPTLVYGLPNSLMKFIASGTPGNGEWTVSIGNTANITEGTASSSGSGNATYCTIGAHSGVATGTDSYAIYYTITGKSSKGIRIIEY